MEQHLWQLAAAIVSALCAVISAWFARRAEQAQRATEGSDVVDLAQTVEKLARAQRRDTMRRVRSATAGTDAGSDAASAPPELALAHPPALTGKAAIRARLKQRGAA